MSKLDQSVKNFYNSKQLDPKSLQRILAQGVANRVSANGHRKFTWGMAAVPALVVGITLSLYNNHEGGLSAEILARLMLEEIHMNHQKNPDVEFALSDASALSR
ncbi:MAG: hypothetical protein OEZ68_12750 [Gammaproteobacteria bacterium]|nr:hypothetical protein [Gammaproteobacteria bacterium]MDH5801666.1 hypothetical protein [Gammaproteobacteria bacterium]